jgi:hypothetical protein
MPEAEQLSKKMGTKRSSDDLVEGTSSKGPRAPPPSAAADGVSSLFEPETVQPEWLELPTELQQIDFQKEGSAAWDKYQPYSDVPPILTPVDTSPTFIDQPGHYQYSTSRPYPTVHARGDQGDTQISLATRN